VKAGDLCWVHFPSPGAEPGAAVRRPAVVLQDEAVGSLLPTVLVIPLTLEVEALRYPGTVAVEPDRENGLQRSLVALVFQITAVDARLLEPTTGHLAPAILARIWAALDRLTGRSSGAGG